MSALRAELGAAGLLLEGADGAHLEARRLAQRDLGAHRQPRRPAGGSARSNQSRMRSPLVP